MAHTRGGGIGNMPGSDDRTLTELIAELHERLVVGEGYAEVSGDELERLVMSRDEVASLKQRLFEMQSAAISFAGQLKAYERKEMMDKRSDDDGGRRTPLERIKAEHALKRAEILDGDIDEVEWSTDVSPEQVGLQRVWADDNGKLWVIVKEGDQLKLKRLWHIA